MSICSETKLKEHDLKLKTTNESYKVGSDVSFTIQSALRDPRHHVTNLKCFDQELCFHYDKANVHCICNGS